VTQLLKAKKNAKLFTFFKTAFGRHKTIGFDKVFNANKNSKCICFFAAVFGGHKNI
jgi:hypothetical protein